MKPRLKLVTDEKPGPSLGFLRLTRNPALPSPSRFEPTKKNAEDIVI